MEEVQTVPLAAYEAQAERTVRMVKYMSVGWVATVLALIFVILCVIFYSEVETEAVEEVQESYVTQDTGEAGGVNAYAGGDFNGNATSSNTNNYTNDQDD